MGQIEQGQEELGVVKPQQTPDASQNTERGIKSFRCRRGSEGEGVG